MRKDIFNFFDRKKRNTNCFKWSMWLNKIYFGMWMGRGLCGPHSWSQLRGILIYGTNSTYCPKLLELTLTNLKNVLNLKTLLGLACQLTANCLPCCQRNQSTMFHSAFYHTVAVTLGTVRKREAITHCWHMQVVVFKLWLHCATNCAPIPEYWRAVCQKCLEF